MLSKYKEHLKKAKEILKVNSTSGHTKPSQDLYPHQWNWDSGFIAIGYSWYDQKRAIKEIRSLFDAQWTNGMVPQIVFDPKYLGGYFPEPDFWQAESSGKVPEGKLTSGITMPPIHATVCRLIFERAEDSAEAKVFLKEIYPKLKKSHRYLYTCRDPKGEGLVCIRHPWESGVDNSPVWDTVLMIRQKAFLWI